MTEKASLSAELTDMGVRQAGLARLRAQAAAVFDIYCKDIRTLAQELARTVKDRNLIGLHPFMAADVYNEQEDKAVATLMSALIPMKREGLLERVDAMKRLLGGSPWDFIQGRYKVLDYLQYSAGIGCTRWQLQQWAAILAEAFMSPKDMLIGNIEHYMKAYEFKQTEGFKESYAEAVFWLQESVPDYGKGNIHVPLTRAVKGLISAWVPRYRQMGWEEAVKLFQFDYPAMVWYAAQGREMLYEEHYDDIWRMERNLRMKVSRGMLMNAYERWRFKRTFIDKLRSFLLS